MKTVPIKNNYVETYSTYGYEEFGIVLILDHQNRTSLTFIIC